MEDSVVFIDVEVGEKNHKIRDFGAVKDSGAVFHSGNKDDFFRFVGKPKFVCGHNIIHHDLKFINEEAGLFQKIRATAIDTLYLSPLLFPKRPYHALVKNDKLQTEELNNPVNDSLKAKELLYDEINAFTLLSEDIQQIFCHLLYDKREFHGFFEYVNCIPERRDVVQLIKNSFEEKICHHADIALLIKTVPCELAYALALIQTTDSSSVTPPWLLLNFPQIENVIQQLCNTRCHEACPYCLQHFNIHKQLKEVFGFDAFRTYNGEALQEKAVQAAVEGESLLAVFPTGGGKSLTFQLPAIISGNTTHGLTVVISPLQSLMKDQVDNLSAQGITSAVTINGLLDPVTRADACGRVADGSASILYISPESLRSRTIEKLLLSRNIVRFVIDEAHCFSAWGQDFRVDYLYIGSFIRQLQQKKQSQRPIPVSCFTATAKPKVISDICDYFKAELGRELKILATAATRTNLHYAVIHTETDEQKYNTLRHLISAKNCPTIVYVSRTKTTIKLAERLERDGFLARPFNGKMEAADKIENQNAFIANKVQIIVATSAFGMGVDKKDVKLVVHYEISDSLENYVQEAGRAGRDEHLQADCYVLFNDADLDKHFILLNQTKLSISEIQQVWKAIKDLTKKRKDVQCSALEIARQAGWDDAVVDVETRVRTAIAALEKAGYVERGQNVPHIFASGILVKNMEEARRKLTQSELFANENEREQAIRIIKSLITSKNTTQNGIDDAESRVDYLADMLGIPKENVINSVNLMRQEGILADTFDMSAIIFRENSLNKSKLLLDKFARLENFLIKQFYGDYNSLTIKELNELAIKEGVKDSSVKNLRTLLFFLTIKKYIRKEDKKDSESSRAFPTIDYQILSGKFRQRIDICRFIVDFLYQSANHQSENDEIMVSFSVVNLLDMYKKQIFMDFDRQKIQLEDIEEALLYLSKIGALRLEGGFLVLYNGMQIKRLVENKVLFKKDDYRLLDEFYKQKIQQIHIVGEYANLMVKSYDAALQFVQDYFQTDFKKFISKYFKGERSSEIKRNISPQKFQKIFGELSEVQSNIINDKDSRRIVVAAGPGSGKTRVLVHKLASLLIMEDVKHEQLLMLTFSRAAATEFKMRLIELIGNAAYFVDIKTFHSYSFDILGKIGNLTDSQDVVKRAVEAINQNEVEQGKITKTVLVIDEAQDMDENEYALVRALMHYNEDMRVIAVGDDDQNIYEFRGSSSSYFRSLMTQDQAIKYEMVENYRSAKTIVELANQFVHHITSRMKKSPIHSMFAEVGVVELVRHQSNNLEIPVVQNILNVRPTGKTCILTNTNEEALRLVGLLRQHQLPAKLIQSLDGFRFYDLAEVRYFMKVIRIKLTSPMISNELWENSKEQTQQHFQKSTCLPIIRQFFLTFEKINNKKYFTDLQEFTNESQIEDFLEDEKNTIFVSTIHKAKGREFDTVFLMLNQVNVSEDADFRKIYVGMTRAKKELYIHCNNDLFKGIHFSGMRETRDNNIYPEPQQIILQLTHRDVFLGFFKDKKKQIFSLSSGSSLFLVKYDFFAEINGQKFCVARLSKAFAEYYEGLRGKGYEYVSSRVRFIVAWKGEDDTEESAVILPELVMQKHS